MAADDPEGSEASLSEGELFRIAADVGLSEAHVRRALTEVRRGSSVQGGGGVVDRIFGPAMVHASRTVPQSVTRLTKELDEFFVATQLLQRVRRGHGLLQYRPALDWASKLAQAASFSSSKYFVASAKWVEVHLEEVTPERTVVEISVDPGTRSDQIAGAVLGGGAAGVAVGVGTTALLTPLFPLGAAVVVAATAGSLATGGITAWTGRTHRSQLAQVQAELEGILDRLELGETLEPPPPSWRQWVKRQFHGVARDFMSGEDF